MDIFHHPDHVPQVWFDDGNLILQAQETRFRVFKGLLANKSSVFSTMLSLPQPPEEEFADGCPIIHFQDSAQEMGCFLKAIYDSSFFEPPPTETHPTIIASILRLSAKYDVPYLRWRALQHLDTLYPLTLSLFDKRQDTRTTPWIANTAFFISTIARDLDLLWLLPSALYCVCSCPLSEIATGFMWSGSLTHMAPVDRDACLRALAPLTNVEHLDVLAFLTKTDTVGCTSRMECAEGKLASLRVLNALRDIVHPLDAFYGRWETYSKSVCAPCLEKSKSLHDAARTRLWESLPGLFGLPPWDKLAEMQRKALKDS